MPDKSKPFSSHLDAAAKSVGIDRAEGDHEVNLLVESRPVQDIHRLTGILGNLPEAQRSDTGPESYAALIASKARALMVVARAIEAFVAETINPASPADH